MKWGDPFDTGPNEPIQRDVLVRLEKYLEGLGFNHVDNDDKYDQYGRFAVKFVEPSSRLPFYVVGRGSEFYAVDKKVLPKHVLVLYTSTEGTVEVISIHKPLYESWKGAIVLGWLPIGIQKPAFYVFDSELVSAYFVQDNNYREYCPFVNFPLKIAGIWNPEKETLKMAWERFKQQKEQLLKRYITTFM